MVWTNPVGGTTNEGLPDHQERYLTELIHHPAKRRMLPVLDLDPAITPAAAIRRIDPLRHNTLQPHAADVLEHVRARHLSDAHWNGWLAAWSTMLAPQVSQVSNAALVEAVTLPLDHAFGFELADVGPAAIEVQRANADALTVAGLGDRRRMTGLATMVTVSVIVFVSFASR
jgi:hypothetical protein